MWVSPCSESRVKIIVSLPRDEKFERGEHAPSIARKRLCTFCDCYYDFYGFSGYISL